MKLWLALLCLPLYSWATQSLSLHVVSFNIKGLPSFTLKDEYKEARYPLIGKLLAGNPQDPGPAIVALQEAFDAQTSQLLQAARFPYRADGPSADGFLGVNSGLYILSKHPIIETGAAVFGSKNCISWDCFANKGVQFARIAIPGMPKTLEVYNTHLQAGREDTKVRQAQVRILLDFYKKWHQPDSPVIFAGDFNFRPGLGQQSYRDFSDESALQHAGKYCLEKGCAKGTDDGWHGIWERAVDHQFFSKGSLAELLPTRLERKYREPVDSLKLSDHPSHEVHYQLRWKDAVQVNLPVARPRGITGSGSSFSSEKALPAQARALCSDARLYTSSLSQP